MFDWFMYTFFNYNTNVIELAIGFMFFVVIMDSIFNLIGMCINALKR